MNIVKGLNLIGIASVFIMASVSIFAKESVMVMTPKFEYDALQHIRNQDTQVIVDKLQHSLQQSLIASGHYDIKTIQDGRDGKDIERAIDHMNPDDNKTFLSIENYLSDHNVDLLMHIIVTSVAANRVIEKMNDSVNHYRDRGSISVTIQLIDVNDIAIVNDEEDVNVDKEAIASSSPHLIYSNDVVVSYVTPFKKLTSSDTTNVNTQFWNEIIEEASSQIVSDLDDTSEL